MHNLEVPGNALLKWFNDNRMKANPGKYHLLLSVSDYSKIAIGNKIISSSKCKKLFEIIIGNNLNFKEHIEFLLFFIYLLFFYLFIHLSIFFFYWLKISNILKMNFAKPAWALHLSLFVFSSCVDVSQLETKYLH